MRRAIIFSTLLLVVTLPATGTTTAAFPPSLDGSGNNGRHRTWGAAGTPYVRVAKPTYADGVGAMVPGLPARYVSDRVFNDVGQNLFSENGVSQWGWAWGQFIDHDMGLRDETPGEKVPIPFDPNDPLESFTNDLGVMSFARTPAAPGTGVTSPRQQINTISSYIDASGVYGSSAVRLDWLRAGSADGNPTNNAAQLMLPGGYLPRVGARGDAKTAPPVDLMGALMGSPDKARVAGDVRANENIALTSIHTLFAREHNRIVGKLPASLSEEQRFQIARRIVAAEIQYVTYNEFLPALGVRLSRYRGYDPRTNASVSNEFAVVGYRAHSMVHGQFDVAYEDGNYTDAQIEAFRAQGIGIAEENGEQSLQIPLTVAFGNPDLVDEVGLAPVLTGLGAERQYRNDEQIDNALRSVLFQIPKPGVADPTVCGAPVVSPDCYSAVTDLAALDIARGRDHGMPSYNDMRRAYGLRSKRSFTAITGESTARFPSDPKIDAANPIDDPNILDFVKLLDADGNEVRPGSPEAEEQVVTGIRRTTLASRLKAIYGSVDKLDAFVGMVSEPHARGSEFGELQLAMWRRQFENLRDGDRFFYLNDPILGAISRAFGLGYRRTLADLIRANAGVTVQDDVFTVAPETGAPPSPNPSSSR